MSRKTARESLFKLVYEYCIRGEKNEQTLSEIKETSSNDDFSYIQSTLDGIVSNYGFLMSKIADYSQGFALDRIYKIDLALLALAAYEVYYIDSIPYSVSANEATELAKVYSTDKSYSYVNGVIAAIIKEKQNDSKNN